MKKSVATKWVKALRSGKYKQGRNVLKDDDKFCCLGVLCDIYDESGWSKSDKYKRCEQGLPKSISEWSGMSTHGNAIIIDTPLEENFKRKPVKNVFLAVKNDQGWSFKKIANWIEKNWKRL